MHSLAIIMKYVLKENKLSSESYRNNIYMINNICSVTPFEAAMSIMIYGTK